MSDFSTSFFDQRDALHLSQAQILEISERRVRAVIETMQVGMLVIEPETDTLIHNPAALNFLNLTREQLVDQLHWQQDDLSEAIDSLSILRNALKLALKGQSVSNCLMDVKRPGSREVDWLLISAEPQLSVDGRVTQVICNLLDITERKQSEDREALLRLITDQIHSTLDLTTILQTAVREVRQLLHTDRVVIYQFTEGWFGQVVVEDIVEPWQSVLGEMGQDDCFSKEYAHLYQEGRIRAIDDIQTAGLDACHVRFLQGLQVQANLVVPIVIGPKLWGLLIAHECNAPRVWHNSETALLRQIGNQLAIAINQAELYNRTRMDALTFSAQAQELSQTLTDLRQAQAQLIQTEKMSSLGQMVAGVAHEINNPISFVYGNLNYLESYSQDLLNLLSLYQQEYPTPHAPIAECIAKMDLPFLVKDLPRLLTSMKVGTERIRQIILSLRIFSRLDEAEVKPVDLHEGIDSTLLILQSRLRPDADQPEIQVIKHYGELPLVECYAGQMNQVFMNILSNAIDALQERKLTLDPVSQPSRITISTAVLKPNLVEVKIADNGIGMGEDVRQRLFEPFYTTKPVGKGTGLGLSISYQVVVKKHGGLLEYSSQRGKGTEFSILIPICPPHNRDSMSTIYTNGKQVTTSPELLQTAAAE